MATVYLARDLKHDRLVALKVLRPDLSAVLGSDRFGREIALATRLQHPHIVPIHDSGVITGQPSEPSIYWFTMPYIEGESLRERLRRESQLPVEEALRIAHEVARALDHAHRHAIIHRDIKPENILLTAEGDTMVADFGIGRALDMSDPGDRLTGTGVVLGTPAYMSPEQMAGDRELDGRTDVYGLGTVLYEMLAGEPPFTGATPQVIIARRLSEAPRPLTLWRDTVPPELERVVRKALGRAPADRYTAGALADALDSVRRAPATFPDTAERPAEPRRGRARRPRHWLGAAALLVLAIAGLFYLLRWRAGSTRTLDPSLVAVAPFDVLDPKLQLWREGLVDLLSRNLDGAGPMRSVAPTVVVRRWRGRADPESAADLGWATGAGLAVYGSLLGAGPDSVRLRATLLDVAGRRTLDEMELRDAADRVDRLTDSLTLRLLRGLGRTRPIGAVRLAGFGSTDLPAVKAFLQGEQFFRRSEWDSAASHYAHAIELDSTFALALRRASATQGWSRTGHDSLSTFYALRAGVFNRGLPARDSLLLTGDSLLASLLEAGPLAINADSLWAQRVRRLFSTAQYAVERFPEDPESWIQLGEARAHMGPYAGQTYEQQVEAFDRAIALDSAFAPSYLHPIEVSMRGGPAEAKRYLDPYLALDPRDLHGGGLRLVRRVLDSAPPHGADPGARYAGESDQELFTALLALNRLPDSSEASVQIARLFSGEAHVAPVRNPAAFRRWVVTRALAARGRLGPRGGPDGLQARNPIPAVLFAEYALLGAVPAESAAAAFVRYLATGESRLVGLALPWWTLRGDTGSIQRAAARGASVAASSTDPVERARGRYLAGVAPAYLALARGDTATALARFDRVNRDDCPGCYLDRLVQAQLLVERRQDRDAWNILHGEPASATLAPLASEVLWNLLRGRVAERIGERERAIRSYAWVAGMWRRPDPELEPYAAEAREALARLTGEKR